MRHHPCAVCDGLSGGLGTVRDHARGRGGDAVSAGAIRDELAGVGDSDADPGQYPRASGSVLRPGMPRDLLFTGHLTSARRTRTRPMASGMRNHMVPETASCCHCSLDMLPPKSAVCAKL